MLLHAARRKSADPRVPAPPSRMRRDPPRCALPRAIGESISDQLLVAEPSVACWPNMSVAARWGSSTYLARRDRRRGRSGYQQCAQLSPQARRSASPWISASLSTTDLVVGLECGTGKALTELNSTTGNAETLVPPPCYIRRESSSARSASANGPLILPMQPVFGAGAGRHRACIPGSPASARHSSRPTGSCRAGSPSGKIRDRQAPRSGVAKWQEEAPENWDASADHPFSRLALEIWEGSRTRIGCLTANTLKQGMCASLGRSKILSAPGRRARHQHRRKSAFRSGSRSPKRPRARLVVYISPTAA